MIAQIENRLKRNLSRARNLLKLYGERSFGGGPGRRAVGETDLLGSAVVFLHATLEELLRAVASWKLPKASPEILNHIPLAGTSLHGRREKFYLGELTRFRGETVSGVIAQSVRQHLERATYNNTREIGALFRAIEFDQKAVEEYYADLQQLMARRHNIVHRADESGKKGSGYPHAKEINLNTVKRWADAVEGLGRGVLSRM